MAAFLRSGRKKPFPEGKGLESPPYGLLHIPELAHAAFSLL